jgi:hypothetical protein
VTTPKIGAIEVNAPPEALWTSSDSNVTTVVNSGPAAVYRVDGPLDPSTCSKLGAAAHA